MRNYKTEPDYEEFYPTPFADERLDFYCCYCGAGRNSVKTTKDHVPSIGIFDETPPSLLPTVRVCQTCNQKFSPSEQYFYCAVSVALSGSPRPSDQIFQIAKRNLENDKRLRRIFATTFVQSEDGSTSLNVNIATVFNFLEKQARGHIFLEYQELKLVPAATRWFAPGTNLTDEDLRAFFDKSNDVYPEIGSRGFERMIDPTGPEDRFDMDQNGFIVLKNGVYHFRVILCKGDVIVQSIIHNYLYTEIRWS